MAKKEQPVVLHMTIPVDGSGIAEASATKGDVGKLYRITFGNSQDLADAIYNMVADVVDMEIQPPPDYSAQAPAPAAPPVQAELPAAAEEAPEDAPTPEQGDDEEPAGEEEEIGEEYEQPGEEIEEPVYENDLSDTQYEEDVPADDYDAEEEEIEKNPGL